MKDRSRKRRRLTILVASAGVLATVVTFVGPWPTYGERDIVASPGFRRALAAITTSAAESQLTAEPGRLIAGWARRALEPPPGVPLAGYGERQGRPSTGIHDQIAVEALVLSDGADAVAVVSIDLLIVPEELAWQVRTEAGERLGLRPSAILFATSHTHSGPGGFAPGWAGRQFAGEYDPAWVESLAETMTLTIANAWHDRGPAQLAHGKAAVPEYVANRTRPQAAVDTDLQLLRVDKADGRRCIVVSYAAHATVLDADNMEMSGDYPGFLERAIERQTGAFTIFLAGAMGSMEPEPPPATDAFARARAMGEALAERVVAAADPLIASGSVDVATAATAFELPPFQVRLSPGLRLSPVLVRALGPDRRTWIHGVRLGDVVLVGTPSDFSGELSVDLKAWADGLGVELWPLSFNGDYMGYVSPDRYYRSAARSGREGYEMYTMSWHGPQQGEIFTHLIRHLVQELTGGSAATAAGWEPVAHRSSKVAGGLDVGGVARSAIPPAAEG